MAYSGGWGSAASAFVNFAQLDAEFDAKLKKRTAEIHPTNREPLETDLKNFRDALEMVDVDEAFMNPATRGLASNAMVPTEFLRPSAADG